ncbi:unnamed protein product [Dracunculus medinensis]|uniref:Histidine-rich glycoprotein-like n=1 Tax=Dracunculus medinensis TaxID=318479 RepID=A0A0N4UNW7_DRAME|nr:unnamed protein product [Dracunculus medinensis]
MFTLLPFLLTFLFSTFTANASEAKLHNQIFQVACKIFLTIGFIKDISIALGISQYTIYYRLSRFCLDYHLETSGSSDRGGWWDRWNRSPSWSWSPEHKFDHDHGHEYSYKHGHEHGQHHGHGHGHLHEHNGHYGHDYEHSYNDKHIGDYEQAGAHGSKSDWGNYNYGGHGDYLKEHSYKKGYGHADGEEHGDDWGHHKGHHHSNHDDGHHHHGHHHGRHRGHHFDPDWY